MHLIVTFLYAGYKIQNVIIDSVALGIYTLFFKIFRYNQGRFAIFGNNASKVEVKVLNRFVNA